MGRFDTLFVVHDYIRADSSANPDNTQYGKRLESAKLAIIDAACASLDPDFDYELWNHAHEVRRMFVAYDKERGPVRDGVNTWNKANLFAEFSDECGTLFSNLRRLK